MRGKIMSNTTPTVGHKTIPSPASTQASIDDKRADKPAVTNRPGTPNATPPNTGTPTTVSPEDVKAAKEAAEKEELEFIESGGFMLAPQLAKESAPVRARSDKQLAMDKKVRQLHAKWVSAGRPTVWDGPNGMVAKGAVTTYFVTPDKSADLKKLITRAAAFVKVGENKATIRARMGTSFKVTPKHIADYGLPESYLGREAISFAILETRQRATTTDGKSGSEVVEDKK